MRKIFFGSDSGVGSYGRKSYFSVGVTGGGGGGEAPLGKKKNLKNLQSAPPHPDSGIEDRLSISFSSKKLSWSVCIVDPIPTCIKLSKLNKNFRNFLKIFFLLKTSSGGFFEVLITNIEVIHGGNFSNTPIRDTDSANSKDLVQQFLGKFNCLRSCSKLVPVGNFGW